MAPEASPHSPTGILGFWHDAERCRRGEEQGAHPIGAPGQRGHREGPAGPGDLLRYRAARHALRQGTAEYHLASFRVRPAVSAQVDIRL